MIMSSFGQIMINVPIGNVEEITRVHRYRHLVGYRYLIEMQMYMASGALVLEEGDELEEASHLRYRRDDGALEVEETDYRLNAQWMFNVKTTPY